MKKVISMQDISCVGKCSNTVALPILSALNIETTILPTALLSTHTMFKNPTFLDLSDQMLPIIEHFKREQFSFDGVYVGYLGKDKQIEIARTVFHTYPNALKVLDPCMADHGKLYHGFDEAYVQKLRTLCIEADIIIPNLTECCLLLDEPYNEQYDEQYIQQLLKKLTSLGSSIAIITGISIDKQIGAYAYFKDEDRFYYFGCDEQPQSFHGTGDMWGAVFFGSLIQGMSYEDAIQLACTYVTQSIAMTLQEENHNIYGTNFESALYLLTNKMKTTIK